MAPIIKLEWLYVSIYLLTSAFVVLYTCLPTALIKVSLPLAIVDHLCVRASVRACLHNNDCIFLPLLILQIMEPPWKAYNVFNKMEYPYEASAILLSFPCFCFIDRP